MGGLKASSDQSFVGSLARTDFQVAVVSSVKIGLQRRKAVHLIINEFKSPFGQL